MIERIVLLKLVDTLCNTADRSSVAADSQVALEAVPGVQSCEVSIAGDPKTELSWDVCLKVRFATLADYDGYAEHPLHRAYLDGYLPSRTTFKKAWNFNLDMPES